MNYKIRNLCCIINIYYIYKYIFQMMIIQAVLAIRDSTHFTEMLPA